MRHEIIPWYLDCNHSEKVKDSLIKFKGKGKSR
jgi:hypothetical protein